MLRGDTYDPGSGALLSSFSTSGCANVSGSFTWVEIATDAAGNVYLPCAPENLAQNGAELHPTTKIAVAGCPKVKKAAKHTKGKHKYGKSKHAKHKHGQPKKRGTR